MNNDQIETILLQYIERDRPELADADPALVDEIWERLFATGLLQRIDEIGYAGGADLVKQQRKTRTSAGAARLDELKKNAAG